MKTEEKQEVKETTDDKPAEGAAIAEEKKTVEWNQSDTRLKIMSQQAKNAHRETRLEEELAEERRETA